MPTRYGMYLRLAFRNACFRQDNQEELRRTAPDALAFDMYGTLVDPIRIWTRLEQYLPDKALRIAEVWRQKQLEYSFG